MPSRVIPDPRLCTHPACTPDRCCEHVAENHAVRDRQNRLQRGSLVPVQYTCANCNTEFHNCGHHRNISFTTPCMPCLLCTTCLDQMLEHRHCSGCMGDVSNMWYCVECGRGHCCRSVSSNDGSLCSSCYEDIHEDDDTYYHDDCDCEDHQENENGPIRGYSSRDYPAPRPANPKVRPFLYLGVELETEHPSGVSPTGAARQVIDQFDEYVILKHDSSLNNGYECVTGPFSLDVHHELWPRLAPAMSGAGSRSWGYESTGIHVHMSRDFFTPLMLGKLQVFLNSEHTREMVVKLAGRTSEHYAKLRKKKLTDLDGYDRYDALNLTNERTIEIRIFKGTLNVEHILANIEFCHALAYWVNDVSVADCEHWDRFMTYVLQHRKLYQRLINYLARFEIAEVISTTSEVA